MYLFGGVSNDDVIISPWILNLTSWNWYKPPISPVYPPPRWGHSLVIVQPENKILLFGGWDFSKALDDLWELDLKTWIWKEIIINDKKPAGRWSHCAVSFNRSEMFIYGGYAQDDLSNDPQNFDDLWVFNINTKYWLRKNSSFIPPPHTRGACLAINEREFISFGGVSNDENVNDVWIYRRFENKWVMIQKNMSQPNFPSARYNHVMVLDRNTIYVFGGSLTPKVGTQFNDTWTYTLKDLKWTRDFPDISKDGLPHSREHISAILYKNGMVVFGGYGGYDPDHCYWNDLWYWKFN